MDQNKFNERRKLLTVIGKTLITNWLCFLWPWKNVSAKDNKIQMRKFMKLPSANTNGTTSVEQAIAQRRSHRSFMPKILSLDQLAQLLWATQGVTDKNNFYRSAPSAGALYPMDIYFSVGQDCVSNIEAGVYHYEPREHAISQLIKNDLRVNIAKTSLFQMWMANAPVSFIITAEYKRVSMKYGARGERYAMIEAGHIGQNLFLQAEAMGLKSGIIGAFDDAEMNKLLNLPRSHEPLLIMPVGYGQKNN